MSYNRLHVRNGARNRFFGEGEACGFQRGVARSSSLTACPFAAMGALGWPQLVYWMALRQAQEVVRPSWIEHALMAGPN